ncbi:hypothetical protein NW766_001838 [Fusarium irregulare]|uniref:HpcH/HpaI aldolase/citrate lyase domain-containing protein n=1 Tax=Fusarium irregulare TaxID=2494466 RepID=A0A9W8PZM1_9HYPO|nr:hypothetical protein NW766_001838 [Fusarium irregulare]
MPYVQNAEQAKEFVRLARFPPFGDRSFPPASLINKHQRETPPGKRVYDIWNDHAAVICQIEDLEAVENIEEICQVAGVDGLFIGTGDLRLCMGLATGSLDGDEPRFVSALQKIRDAAKINGLPMMGFGISHSTRKKRIAMGWNAFIIHGDIDGITQSASLALDSYADAAMRTLSNGHGDVCKTTSNEG